MTALAPGWDAAAEEARFAVERMEGEATYHVGLLLSGVALPGAAAFGADLPPRVELLRVDGTAVLSAPLNLAAADGVPPRLIAFELAELRLDWGGAALRISGGPVEIGARRGCRTAASPCGSSTGRDW